MSRDDFTLDIGVCSYWWFQVKIEKYYIPMFEVFVRMPSFHLETENYIEATVTSEYTHDKVYHINVFPLAEFGLKLWFRKDLEMH